MKLNGEGGFPHSEICGSKVAHTSPQLIAACHVLHRLYAPRHPRIALTSRLRVRTTNDRAETPAPLGADNLLSIVIAVETRTAAAGLRLRRMNRASRHRFLEPIHNVKDRSDDPTAPEGADRFSHNHWKVVEPIGIEPMTSSLQS